MARAHRLSSPRRAVTASLAAVALLSLMLATPAGARVAGPARIPREPDFARVLRPKLLAKMQQLRVPGAIVLVNVPGQGQWFTALGVSDIETGAPMRTNMHMRAGSITKTVTATVVLHLVDQGRVGLDDPVSDYVGGVPNGRHITVRELLNMTSGLFNQTEDEGLNAALDADPGRVWHARELLGYAFTGHDPYFKPGEGWHYSNTNYVLLGMIAERVTGTPLNVLMRRWVFGPLGMDDTELPRRSDVSIPAPFSHGYTYGTNVDLLNAYLAALAGDVAHAQITRPLDAPPDFDSTYWNTSYTWPDGAMISTAHDLKIWAKALVTGRLLSRATQAQRLQSVPGAGYGLGIEFVPFGGLIGHNGAIPGYQSFMGYEPDTGTTIVVLANLILGPNTYLVDGLPADEMAKIIANEVLPA